MSSIKVVMVVKESALVETMQELGDVLAGENVVIKVEKDYVFDSIFDINTEKVDIDIDDDLLFDLMKKAHEKNITLNQYITEIIAKQIDEMNKEKEVNTIPDMIASGIIEKKDTNKFKKIHDYEEQENITLSSKFRDKPLNGLVDELLAKH